MSLLNQKQKKDLVIELLKKGYRYREIQKQAHVSPSFITQVIEEFFGEDYVFQNQPRKISKNSQAIDLIRNGKKPIEIALKLNMDSDEVNKAYSDYFRLNNLEKFANLVNPENSKKFNILLMITDILQQKGITDTDSISAILIKLKDLENLQKQIKYSISNISTLKHEILNLQSYMQELKQYVALKKSYLRFYDKKLNTVKSEIFEKTQKLAQLKKLCRDIYDMPAYEHLQNTLINNIEYVILNDHKFIPLIMVGVVEALKADPQKTKSLYEYCKKFKNEKLALDNIDSRIDYFKSSEFWDDTSIYFQKLAEVYSEEVFAYVLKEQYKSYKLNKNIRSRTVSFL